MCPNSPAKRWVPGSPVGVSAPPVRAAFAPGDRSAARAKFDLPRDGFVALVSCGVATGYGSAVNRANVRPGDTVAVLGVGGIGINAVQGARIAGARQIIAVDPIPFKREQAKRFGATHVFASLDEAIAGVTRSVR